MNSVSAPEWATQLRVAFDSRASGQFVVHGNVSDRMPSAGQLVNVEQYIRDELFADFDVVFTYDLGNGLGVVRGGDLLPAVDAEWVTSAQRAHRRTVLELLDLVAETSWKAGDLDDSRRHLRQAIDLEPHDEIRYVRLARVLLRQGRRGSAREVVRRALAAAAEIGATPSESLVDLVRQLGRKREPVPVPDAVTA